MQIKSKLMDVTLRDGSYVINFGFTAQDTRLVCAALEQSGIELIEIGHGVGLNASNCGMGEAVETDESYLKAAASTLKKAKFGMFCIPGIARLEDIDMAAEYGMGFIRIGTNVSEVKKGIPYIEHAKKYNMLVCCNFMKSYTSPPREFAKKALRVKEYGGDLIYLVDSSGSMVPSDIVKYFKESLEVGVENMAFHGHNNLGMANANSLKALECGAVVVDSSLQGIGRSSGNAITEQFLPLMTKAGIDHGLDLYKIISAGQKFIRPHIRQRGHLSLDIISGFAQFHSSYMGLIRKYSSLYDVDPRRLIMKICEISKVDCPEELVDKIASLMPKMEHDLESCRFNFEEYFGHEQD